MLGTLRTAGESTRRRCSGRPRPNGTSDTTARAGRRPLHRRGPLLPAGQGRRGGVELPVMRARASTINERTSGRIARELTQSWRCRHRANTPSGSRVLLLGMTYKGGCGRLPQHEVGRPVPRPRARGDSASRPRIRMPTRRKYATPTE